MKFAKINRIKTVIVRNVCNSKLGFMVLLRTVSFLLSYTSISYSKDIVHIYIYIYIYISLLQRALFGYVKKFIKSILVLSFNHI
jgi:hypothetical protein